MGKRLIWLIIPILVPFLFLTSWISELNNPDHYILAAADRQNQVSIMNGAAADNGVLIDGVLYDGYEYGDLDEAVRLRNNGDDIVDLSGWHLSDGGVGRGELPLGVSLNPGQVLWITRNADAFERQFGFTADLVLQPWPGFANHGDEVILSNAEGAEIDVLVYGDGSYPEQWTGSPVEPYKSNRNFAEEGQILTRKRNQIDGKSLPDSDQAADWAQDRDDPINGRKAFYPGWDYDEFFFTHRVTETAELTIAIAPDNALKEVLSAIDNARESIDIEVHTLKSLEVSTALARAAERGVSVTVLLEGSPVGGLPAQEKYICRELEASGAACWFMINDEDDKIHDRYRYLHAKFMIFDRELVVVSSENLSYGSLPGDDKSDGTWGRRGVLLFTDAPSVIDHFTDVFNRDFDPINHVDLFRWQGDHPIYGNPPQAFIPVEESGGISYTIRYPHPLRISGAFAFEILQSPENSLRDVHSLLGLLKRAGRGDTILVQQLAERAFWGPSGSDAVTDPNPRLNAYVEAARRGAQVRLLLDSYFDRSNDEKSNEQTCKLVNEIAKRERLNLSCALGNPTGLGIHNKMILAQIRGEGFVHIGSINGTELSGKGNREVALQVQSDAAYSYLANMFERDTPHVHYLSIMMKDYQGPANHLLISEVLYDPNGLDDAEFIEIYNPTSITVGLDEFSLGDALHRDDYEDVRKFPQDAIIDPFGLIVVSPSAVSFRDEFGYWPDFEILETSEEIANMLDDPTWGVEGLIIQLGNLGDEIILRDQFGNHVDALSYGSGKLANNAPCSLALRSGYSLERVPIWRNTNNCFLDFRYWPFPTPGKLPKTE